MRKYAIEFDGEFANCDSLKINNETIEEIKNDTINDFVKLINSHIRDEMVVGESVKWMIEDFAEQMKKEING